MAQKRPASHPPPGPGQPSSRLRTPRITATNGASGTPGSSAAGGSVGSSEKVATPTARVRGSGAGSSAKRLSATPGSGSRLKRGGKPVSASGSAAGKLTGSGKKAQAGAGSPGAARPISSESDTSVDFDTNVDFDEDDEDGIHWEDVDLGPQGAPAVVYSFVFLLHS